MRNTNGARALRSEPTIWNGSTGAPDDELDAVAGTVRVVLAVDGEMDDVGGRVADQEVGHGLRLGVDRSRPVGRLELPGLLLSGKQARLPVV